MTSLVRSIKRLIKAINERTPSYQAAQRIDTIDQQFKEGNPNGSLTRPEVVVWYQKITDLVCKDYLHGNELKKAENVLSDMVDNYLSPIIQRELQGSVSDGIGLRIGHNMTVSNLSPTYRATIGYYDNAQRELRRCSD